MCVFGGVGWYESPEVFLNMAVTFCPGHDYFQHTTSLGVCVVLFVHSFHLMKMDLCLYIHFLLLTFLSFLSLSFFLWNSKYIILKVPAGKVSYYST